MNVRQLRFFLQTAEIGSVTGAASFLHITQPALSRQLQQLEEELGVALFQRSDRGVSLTDAGRLLRERATSLLQHFEHVRQEVRDAFNAPSGNLSVAMPPSMLDLVTLPALQRYRQRYPDVMLRIVEGIGGVLNAWSMVKLAKADLAVVTNIEPLATLEASAFLQEALCLIGPKDAGLDPASPVPLEEVAARQIIVPSRPNTLRLVLETAMGERKLPLRIAFEGSTPQLVLASVERGLGFATLPFCSASRLFYQGRVRLAPIAGLEVTWNIIQSREQPLSMAGERMKDVLREVAREQVSSQMWHCVSSVW